jgi:hypothetical protein
MSEPSRDEVILVARTAGAAAGALMASLHRLDVAVAEPGHRNLLPALAEVVPLCRALALSFPQLRTRVAGLVYQSVEYARYEGSSALHIVAQIADLLLESTKWVPKEGNLSQKALEALAKEVGECLPPSLDGDWLRNHLDTELAALEKDLGATITDAYRQTSRPKYLARIERKIGRFLAAPGKVVLATKPRERKAEGAQELTVEFPTEKLAMLSEGPTTVRLKGERQVWVFRKVYESAGRTVEWDHLVLADIQRASEQPGVGERQQSGRMATSKHTFQRTGNRIRTALGKLAYHWHQDGRGASWAPEVQ